MRERYTLCKHQLSRCSSQLYKLLSPTLTEQLVAANEIRTPEDWVIRQRVIEHLLGLDTPIANLHVVKIIGQLCRLACPFAEDEQTA